MKDGGGTSSSSGGGHTTSGGNGKDGQLSCPKCGNPCSQVETFVCKYSSMEIFDQKILDQKIFGLKI